MISFCNYIPHPSQLKTRELLSGDMEAVKRFQTHEMVNVALQRYTSLGKHKEDYERSKTKELERITDPSHREVIAEIHVQTELFMNFLNSKIIDKMLEQKGVAISHLTEKEKARLAHDIQESDPLAYKSAREVVIVHYRLVLAAECNQLDDKIAALQADSIKSGKHEPSNLPQMHRLILEKNKIYTLLNLLQDEGTNTQSEGEVTLFQKEGQIHTGALSKARKKIVDEVKKFKGVVGLLAQKNGGQF